MAFSISTLTSGAEAVTGLTNMLFGGSGAITLEQIVFQGFEVPEYISIGGQQQMTVHKLVGGERVIDVLGDDPADISWSGTFMDNNPWDKVQELEHLRSVGDPLGLQWGKFFYTVVLRSFSARTLYGRATYEISCAVLRNEATAPGGVDDDLTDSVGSDLLKAVMSAPAAIAPVLSAAQTAVGLLGPLIPGSAKIGMALAKVSGMNSAAGGLAASAGAAMGAVSNAVSLSSMTANAGVLAGAQQTLGYIGRAIGNLHP